MEYKVKQLKPNHADHISMYNDKFLSKMLENEVVIAQPKYDGERMLIHINNGEVYCTSRRFSKKTDRYMENQDKLPVLQNLVNDSEALRHLEYTVIDCECYSKDWSTIAGILHSLPERAVALQALNPAKFAVFDCLWYDGNDMRDLSYDDRIVKANEIVEMFNSSQMHIIPFFSNDLTIVDLFNEREDRLPLPIRSREDANKVMNTSIAAGFEGIVIKSLSRKYYDKAASLKCKKFETVDVVVYDYVQGRGKYSDTIGALKVGYYDKSTGTVVHMSNVNCSTDTERNAWRDNWHDWQFSVIEVLCQEITDRSLRHPRYVRRREDKDFTMCTRETIFK